MIAVTAIYFVPLVYISNKEFIDEHLSHASNVITEQASQVRGLAAQQANQAFEATSNATSQYVSKAQEMMGTAKKTAVDKGYVNKDTANTLPGVPVEKANSTASSFPAAPKTEPVAPTASVPKSEPVAVVPKTEPSTLSTPSAQPVIQTPAVAQ